MHERIFSGDKDKDLDPDYVLPDLEPASDEEGEDEVYGAVSKTPGTPVRVTPRTSTGGFTTPKGPFRVPIVPPLTPAVTKKRQRAEAEPTHSGLSQKNLFPADLTSSEKLNVLFQVETDTTVLNKGEDYTIIGYKTIAW